MRRRGLGSSTAEHQEHAQRALADIEKHASAVVEKTRAGNCTGASIDHMRMHDAIGRFEAHQGSMTRGAKNKSPLWYPQRSVMDANGVFSDRCVRVHPQHGHELGALSNDGVRRAPPEGRKVEPPPVYHERKGPPPGVPLRGARRRRRK